MTREEAIERIEFLKVVYSIDEETAIDMAIEALQFMEHFDLLKEYQSIQEVVRCKDCKYQDECEEVVLFDINDNEVMGHRIHWCSYGQRR